MSYIYLTIGMNVTSKDNKEIITGRASLIAIRKSHQEVSSKNYKNRTEITELIKALEINPNFQIEWLPEEKYKSTFNNLKKEKGKLKITFYFFERKNSTTGDVIWGTTATATGVTITNANDVSKQRGVAQIVDIKSDSFKENIEKK